jgi:two-component system, OmpR family, response regulator MprA
MSERMRIVVVDDDELVRGALNHLFCASGYEVCLFASAEEMLAHDVVADCFLLDVCLPLLNGVELAQRIRSSGCDVPIVLMTAHDHESARAAIVQSGLPLVRKPFDEGEILRLVAGA